MFTRLVLSTLLSVATLSLGSIALASRSAEKVKKETGEAAEATNEFLRESREEFQRTMKKNLALLEENIADLKTQASTTSESARKGLSKHIAILETRRDKMKKDLAELSDTSDRAWSQMRSGLERAWREVKTAYVQASSEFERESQPAARSKRKVSDD